MTMQYVDKSNALSSIPKVMTVESILEIVQEQLTRELAM